MRSNALVWVAALLLAAPGLAQAADDDHDAGRFLRMLRSWTEYAAARLQANQNVVDPFSVEGKGNTVINIDRVVLNIELGDVVVNENSTEDGGAELAHRLLDMLAERTGPDRAPHAPQMPPPEMGHRWMPPAEREELAGEYRERARQMAGPHQPPMRPEVMELLMQIPPDVEPEFVEFIMHVGRLARENPEFHKRLELLVERAHQAMQERESRDEPREGRRH